MAGTARTASPGTRTLAPDRFSAVSLRMADLGKRLIMGNHALFKQTAGMSSSMLETLSPHAAMRAAAHARRRVPAYRTHLVNMGWRDSPDLPAAERLRLLPETDKATYVKAYSTEERCLGGRIPLVGTEIDESSGSSGTPFNWVRSAAELRELHREMSQFVRYLVGGDVFAINGFSMGAWATGVNAGEALRLNGIVKSTGPDVAKIVHTLQFFGPRYTYLITGYPPFLKHLIDVSEAAGIDWRTYRAYGIVGGEGMSEGLRAYLESRFQSVYSAYGASDLAIGIASEMPISVWIRKQAAANRQLQTALFGPDSRLPMLFQYNPLDYYIEENADRELIITVNRLSLLSPRIRYNIHDTGGVISFDKVLAILRDFGLDPVKSLAHYPRPFRLPFLYLFGRSDSTISYMGANIYPEDIEHALLHLSGEAPRLGTFCLELLDVGGGELRACVHVEVTEGPVDDPVLAERLRACVLERLLEVNLDFRSSVAEDASAGEILVRLHGSGQGPFAGNAGRIKRRYIVSSPTAAGIVP